MSFCLKKRLLIEKPRVDSPGEVLWVHCASVGEFNTFKPILKELKNSHRIALTYFSPRAKEFLESQSGFYDLLFPLPLDLPFLIRKFESLLKPKALIVVERELWFSLIKFTRTKKILVNAYAKGGLMEKLLIPEFQLIVAREEEDRKLFIEEGAKRVEVCGNLKFVQDSDFKPVSLNVPEGYKVFVAGSVREGEEEFILRAFLKVREKIPLKLIAAPRHIKRARNIKTLAESMGLRVSLRSSGDESWDVLVVDTLGELRAIYSLADVTFVGGTMVSVGGHNLLEPAYLGKPVIFGKHTHKVRELESLLTSKGYGFKVGDEGDLTATLERLLREGFSPSEDLRELSIKVKECYMKAILSELE